MNAPATLTRREVAALLGFSPDTFKRRLPGLRAEGFPAPDTLLCRYLRADVEAWLERRHQVAKHGASKPEVNHDAL